jgi:hypothetical protein
MQYTIWLTDCKVYAILNIMSSSRFIRALIAIQGKQSSTAFAAQLGISKQFWSNLRKGRRPLPEALIARCIARWPALVADYTADTLDRVIPSERTA